MAEEAKKPTRQECIIYSRVVGWYTPTKNWNKGKKEEFKDRLSFNINEKTL
jgi:anaerobic ribonucleoside-triphosphate reductase